MDKRSYLDVATRVLGLWQLLLAFDDCATYINMIQKLYKPVYTMPVAEIIYIGAHLLAGSFLLFSASTVVHMVYGQPGPTFMVEPISDSQSGDSAD